MDSQPESKTTPRTRTLFTDTALVAAVPAAIFLLAFCYEFGYAQGFRVPLELVSITWGNALISCASLVLIAFVWFILTQSVFLFLPSGIIAGHVMKYLPYFLFLLVVTVLDWRRWFIWWLFFVVFVTLDSLWPVWFYREKGRTYAERLLAKELAETGGDRPFEVYRRRVGSNPLFTPALILLFGLIVALQLGEFNASHQTEFYLVPTSPETVLLAEYGDTFVLEHFDRKTRKLEGGIILMKLSGGSPLTLQLEKVGPLKAEDEK